MNVTSANESNCFQKNNESTNLLKKNFFCVVSAFFSGLLFCRSLHVRLTDDSKSAVSVNGCLWLPAQGVPHLAQSPAPSTPSRVYLFPVITGLIRIIPIISVIVRWKAYLDYPLESFGKSPPHTIKRNGFPVCQYGGAHHPIKEKYLCLSSKRKIGTVNRLGINFFSRNIRHSCLLFPSCLKEDFHERLLNTCSVWVLVGLTRAQ